MPPQLCEIGFHVENHATQWHRFQHKIQLQEVVVAWIQLTQNSKLHLDLGWEKNCTAPVKRKGKKLDNTRIYRPYFGDLKELKN